MSTVVNRRELATPEGGKWGVGGRRVGVRGDGEEEKLDKENQR